MVPIICWLAVFFTLGQSKADVIAVDATVPNELAVAGTSNNPAVYIVGNTGPVTRNFGTSPLQVGYQSTTITGYSWVHLYIRNGSTVLSGNDSRVGVFHDKQGRIARLTEASSWRVAGKLWVPHSGYNDRLEILGGSVVSCAECIVGGGAGAWGDVLVSGPNSRLIASSNIVDSGAVGNTGQATIEHSGLIRVDNTNLFGLDFYRFNRGFLAWQGNQPNSIASIIHVWNGAQWVLSNDATAQFSRTYYTTDAAAKAATANPATGFAGYDSLGGYTIFTGGANLPSIDTQPVGSIISTGGNATLTVAASGTGPFTYQWRLNGANIPGATSSSLTVTNMAGAQAGVYTVVVTGPGGTVTSAAAPLILVDLGFYAGITVQGAVGQKFQIDYADVVGAVTNWLPLANVTLTTPSQLVIDPGSPGLSKRFYRALLASPP